MDRGCPGGDSRRSSRKGLAEYLNSPEVRSSFYLPSYRPYLFPNTIHSLSYKEAGVLNRLNATRPSHVPTLVVGSTDCLSSPCTLTTLRFVVFNRPLSLKG